jgi:hypothetical protein
MFSESFAVAREGEKISACYALEGVGGEFASDVGEGNSINFSGDLWEQVTSVPHHSLAPKALPSSSAAPANQRSLFSSAYA